MFFVDVLLVRDFDGINSPFFQISLNIITFTQLDYELFDLNQYKNLFSI